MAAKGSIIKAEITEKILETFPNSFLYNDGKEIRINEMENGTPIQIKVTLTAAKTIIEDDSIANGNQNSEDVFSESPPTRTNEPSEPTEDEKERLRNLLEKLNL